MRFLLLPFSILYGLIIWCRNLSYDLGIFKSYQPEVSTIGIGNLRVGGTGKTPMVEYIIRQIGNDFKIGVLSRGYGRRLKGFRIVEVISKADEVGDEPLQIKKNFTQAEVAVCANRVYGIQNLLKIRSSTQVVILDDVFQHRAIQPGLMLLLTCYHQLYCDDRLMPIGRLRESSFGAKRAHVIAVTKCPETLTSDEKERIVLKLNPQKKQHVLFAFEAFKTPKRWNTHELIDETDFKEVILVTGIENPKSLKFHIENNLNKKLVSHVRKNDHHRFTEEDLDEISKLQKKNAQAIVVTTEKDIQRLEPFLEQKKYNNLPVYTLGLETRFFENDELEFKTILNGYLRTGE